MWWDEAAPRKVNVKLSIVGRKKEFIHKFDLVFETDEVHIFQYVYVRKILCILSTLFYYSTTPTNYPPTQPTRIKLDVMLINLKKCKNS